VLISLSLSRKTDTPTKGDQKEEGMREKGQKKSPILVQGK